ncbi:dihydrofolate reductase family protein [Pedobacter sp. Du54]|uniref:dihydrofolate reductase family protein n=1 Tax=Pedobacter anseongensis TaxID=3133439 RepID=UPI0030B1C645
MRKIIAAINMTIDGNFDHRAGLADEEIHQHYAELLSNAGVILYGRITYELMQFWQDLVIKPSGEKSMDDFAFVMDKIPKIVFSHTLKPTDQTITNWKTATLANNNLEEHVSSLKKEPGKDILIGSGSLIIQLMKLNLIDEYQLCVHPVITGKGLQLFENVHNSTIFKLIKTKTFKSGAIILYYQPIMNN